MSLTAIYFKNPRKNKLFVTVAILLSYFFTLPYRIFCPRRVRFGRNFITNWKLKIIGPGKVIFGDNVHAWARHEPNCFFTFSTDATITIGNNTRLNGVGCHSQSGITIGSNCIVGSAIITDTDHHSLSFDRATNLDATPRSRRVKIEDNAWIAGQSAVLKGTTVGNNSIVAFRAVVAGDVTPSTVVAGNPARVVKRL